MNQTTIFDVLYPKYKITKPIRLIELFAGYGSQALALKYLGVKFEHWKICEWAVKSIQAYKDIHFTDDTRNYSEVASKEEIQEMLLKWGISSNYNEPMTREQINRLSEEQLRTIFNNISATNNLVNIQDVKGDDLAIVNKDEYDYILTYSFPCQDLSLAGKGKGMADTSTRSGMLWEVERILNELKTTNSLPQILLMENVPQVHGSDNVEHFNKWQLALERLGYKSYFQDLIATDYGIPQTRNRCFMVSILGDYSYSFPKPIPLKLKLNDLLEKNVNEKYYLSDKFISCMTKEKKGGYPRKERFEQSISRVNNKQIANTITTLEGQRDISTFVIGTFQYSKSDNFMKGKDRLQLGKEVSDTLQTTPKEGICYNNLRIRKLTPLECFRLMGVKDEDYYKVAKNQSNSSLYHLAGDSIVVNVLMAIFKELIK